uniref:Synemin, intermediate filament protein n=1 Tax=Nothobranchius kadleci TaxID=1051664 RepID=A0A1A8BR94_NOTKA
MLPLKRTFESENQQLHELNSRLARYLSRTKQLEQENTHLIAEISKLRQVSRKAEWEQQCKAEMEDLRRMVGQLSLEKSQAEMEREKLWRELQAVQSVCSEQTAVCRDISEELRGCEKELQQAHKTNTELQGRLLRLDNEHKRLEDAHNQEVAHLRHQVESRVAPIITQTYCGAPAVSVEEVQEYTRGLSEGWMETFEMYQKKVEEMERSIKLDQTRLIDLQREKMLYASELDKLRTEAVKQGQIQERLEEQLMNMQEQFRVDLGEHQMIIEQLEHERNMLVDAMEQKMREHQHLFQVKMDLGMEVAAYRALLESERAGLQDADRKVTQLHRERIIDIKMPPQPYTPRASTLTTRQHLDIRYASPSNLRRSPLPSSGSTSPSRITPISAAERARHQSPASRRDMISFNKARAAASAPATTKEQNRGQSEKQKSQNVQKTMAEEKLLQIKQVPPENQLNATTERQSVRVVRTETETVSKQHVSDKKENGSAHDEFKDKERVEPITSSGEKKILDGVSVEEIIDKVIKPAGLEAKVCSSGDSQVSYHVEKTEQEDGTTKTQIVLESKVEEELDVSKDSALDELLSQGVKKVSLEDIENTATGNMIKNLLSSLQGEENLENRSVNVQIIEEPIESHSDEQLEVEKKAGSSFYEPSTYFQIEEMQNTHHVPREGKSELDGMDSSLEVMDQSSGGFAQVQKVFRESESPHFFQDQEFREYFVSTPDEDLSETEEGGGITSCGHYGIVDDLSDERYYQDESLPQRRVIVEESDEHKPGVRSFAKENFPECIIEEEVRVSPIVQESVLEFLREDSLEPKEQLKGALETLQSSVSGPLREELDFLSKLSSENPQNVEVKKVEQTSDNGTMTIVAELNVSQTLEDSGLLDDGDDLSEEQIMKALKASNIEFGKAFQEGAGAGYSIRVSREEGVAEIGGFEGLGESTSEIIEKHVQLEPSEKPFTFQMDVQGGHSETSSGQALGSHILETSVNNSNEKRVATVYLESPFEG